MIRKYARFQESPERVRALFAEVLAWPHWFPGIRSVRRIEQSAGTQIVDLVQDSMGREWKQRLEIRTTSLGFDQRQLRGRLKRWDLSWRFQEPPDGEGTTLALELDVDLGLVGRFTPARVLQQGIDRLFREVVEQARERLREEAPAPQVEGATRPVVEVLSTPAGLEVRWAGRRYRLKPLD